MRWLAAAIFLRIFAVGCDCAVVAPGDAGKSDAGSPDAGGDAGPRPPAGSLDTTFGDGGRAFVALTATDVLFALAVQPDSKILGGGISDPSQIGVFRIGVDGSLDRSFGADAGGVLFTVRPGTRDDLFDMVRLLDGGIVGVGNTVSDTPDGSVLQDIMAFRLRPDGQLDPAFGASSTGITTISLGALTWCAAVTVQRDGALVLGGSVRRGTGDYLAIRLLPNGQLDPTFNGTGIATLLTATDDVQNAVVMLPSGAVLLAGNSDGKASMARFNADGTPDTTFGDGGLLIDDLMPGVPSRIHTLLLQPDGKLIAVGNTGLVPNVSAIVLRYDASGARDVSFGVAGTVPLALAAQPGAALLDAAGRAVFAAAATNAIVVGRVLPDGTMDTSFGTDAGYALFNLGATTFQANAIAEAPDGRLIVAGPSDNHVGLLRLWP
jgi:uncharacterized delta-60 repeat protein